MFFILSKILDIFLTPIFWVFVLFLSSLFLKRTITKKRLVISGLVILYFCSNFFIINFLMSAWEQDPVQLNENDRFDVAIVLTGVTDNIRKPQDRVYFHKGAERITTPLILYKKGMVKKILISGGEGTYNEHARPESIILKRFLLANGVPENDVILEINSTNTYQNAVFSKQTLNKYPELQTKLLVTSSFHMNRSVSCFKKAGLTVVPYPVDFYSSSSNLTFAKLFIPNAQAFEYCTILIHEIVGYWVYKIVGYS